MFKEARGLAGRLSLGFLVVFMTFSLRADQPPEILYASSPAGFIVVGPVTNTEVFANASVCDAAGNLYVTGSFEGTATFGTNVLNSSGGFAFDDIYVAKYDPAGNVLWAKRAGGSGKDYGTAITLDGTGGFFLGGTSDSQPCTIGTNSIYTYFKSMVIAHYDGNGNVLWAQRAGGWLKSFQVQSAVMTVNGLALDVAGNVIVAGSFFGNPTVGGNFNAQELNTSIALTNKSPSFYANSAEDLFLAKFAANGSLLWATNYGGTNTEYATSVAVDSTGAIYTAGSFVNVTVFGAQTYTNIGDGILLAKFSSAGDLVWSSNLSDPTNSNTGAAWAVAVDAADRVTLNFQFDDTAFHTVGFRYKGFIATNSVFATINVLAQFDVNGNPLWVKRSPFGGGGAPNGAQYQRTKQSNLALDKQNNLYLGSAGASIFKCTSAGLPLWTNTVPASPVGVTPGMAAMSVDDSYLTHVTTTIIGDKGTYITVGWTNLFPGFGGFGSDQLLFVLASNFVAVPPIFLQSPTNMIFQPPQPLKNLVQARAWPAPNYFWYINNSKLPSQTNFFLALGPTTFTNQTTYFVVATNAYGSATSIVVNAQAALSFAPSPPTNIYVLVGTTLAISGGASGTSAASYQWQFKGTNIVNATSPTLALPNIALNQGGNYTLVISNATGSLTSAPPSVVTVLPIGSIDSSFTNNNFYVSYVSTVSSLARLPDGGFYSANSYTVLHINPNGSVDTNGLNNTNLLTWYYRWNDRSSADQYLGPVTVLREPNGKLLVAGNFKVYYPTPATPTNQSRLARLNADGTLDTTFNAGVGPLNTIDGTNYTLIESVLRLTNGQYLVAGTFNKFNGLVRTNLVRLNSDGSLDLTFTSRSLAGSPSRSSPAIHALALQADGKILVGGEFDGAFGTPNPNLTRLNTDGTVDATFNQTTIYGFASVTSILPLSDGKILVTGGLNFSSPNNVGSLRFNANGSRDTTWLGVLPGKANAVTLTTSNRLIFGGSEFVRRTSYDGVTDTNFYNASSPFFVGQFTYAVVAEPSGNVIVGGSYGLRRLLLEPNLVVPSFSSGAGVSVVNGQFQLSACGGVDGQNIVVQASTDLVNWANVSTNVVSGGCISYTDPQTPPLPSRYYRLTVLP